MSVTAPSLAPSATSRRRTSRNACSLAALSAKVVEASALEHRLGAGRLNSRDLKGVKNGVRTHFDEGVAQPLLLKIDRDARSEDTFVETYQSIHVGGDKRQVMYVVEQLHVYLRLRASGNRCLEPLPRDVQAAALLLLL